MYLEHFGLREWPFSNTPDPRFVYLSPRHEEALAHLVYGVRERGGFVQLTGEVGTGKTTICRYLLSRLPEEIDVALILNPMLTPEELLATVCDELGATYPPEARTHKAFVDVLYQHLLAAHARGRRTVLIIDEAQNLSAGAMEQLRLLTNLETATEKLLQIILIGQPELTRLLRQPGLRQVAQRITARYHLRPFGEKETRAYIWRRLQVAGPRAAIFEPGALTAVYRASRGVPRLVNVICDRSLLGAFAEGGQRVSARVVRRAAREVAGENPHGRRWPWVAAAAAAVTVAAVAGTGLAGVWRMPPRDAWRWLSAPTVASSPPIAGAALAPMVAPAPAGASVVVAATPPPVAAAPAARSTSAAPAPRTPAGVAPQSGIPVAAMNLSPAPASPAARLTSDLDALLDSVRPPSDRSAALARVLLRWGVAGAPTDDQCVIAVRADLKCLDARGNWTVLRRLGVPAVVKLLAPDGRRQWAAVTGLAGDTVTLELRERVETVSPAAVERLWDGTFTVVWRPLPVPPQGLTPGAQGPGVTWLRRALGDGDATSQAAVYDQALAGRVAAFQRREGLEPDGMAGMETLVRLSAQIDRRTPLLSAAAATR